MKAERRAKSARPRGVSLANLLREAKGGACPPFLRSYVCLGEKAERGRETPAASASAITALLALEVMKAASAGLWRKTISTVMTGTVTNNVR